MKEFVYFSLTAHITITHILNLYSEGQHLSFILGIALKSYNSKVHNELVPSLNLFFKCQHFSVNFPSDYLPKKN